MCRGHCTKCTLLPSHKAWEPVDRLKPKPRKCLKKISKKSGESGWKKSADCKRGRRKGATSKNFKNRQKVSKSFSTLFDNFRAGQKTSKIVEKCQKVFRHFSTIFARHLFSGPFCNPLKKVSNRSRKTFSRLFLQTLEGARGRSPARLFSDFFGVSGPRGPRDPCKWSTGSQHKAPRMQSVRNCSQRTLPY